MIALSGKVLAPLLALGALAAVCACGPDRAGAAEGEAPATPIPVVSPADAGMDAALVKAAVDQAQRAPAPAARAPARAPAPAPRPPARR